MPTLHIRLLGDFHLAYDDALITTLAQARLQALFVYLLLHRDSPQPRQQIAYLFWPNSTEPQALTNLRQILYRLRRSLPAADQFIQIERHTIQWRLDATYTLDIAKFEYDLAHADAMLQERNTASERAALESAVKNYGGDLLPTCYDEWILPERERLRQAYFGALERLIRLTEGQRDYQSAISFAERLLRQDPLKETTYRHLMSLYALKGDRAGALRVYHTCATTIQRELSVEPNAETQEVYHRLLNMETLAVSQTPAAIANRSTLVGRHREWNMLRGVWRRAAAGNAAFVLISGEAGIGKTRLAEAYLNRAARLGSTTARARAYTAEGQLAYALVIELLRCDPFYRRLTRLGDAWLVELSRLLPELLEGRADLPRADAITASWQRTRLFEALTRAVMSGRGPRLILLDDLQWCDRDTLEWLHYLMHHNPRAELLLLGTARREEIDQSHPLMSLILDLRTGEQLTEIELKPLSEDETTALAEQIAGEELDANQATWLFRYTGGNPLFVVETVRAEVDSGRVGWWRKENQVDVSLTSSSSITSRPSAFMATELPHRVRAVIISRLSQLSTEARELATLAAAIGNSFALNVLVQASERDNETILQGLDELWRRRIIQETNSNFYGFSHDRIHEVVYGELSTVRRQALHEQIAIALERVHTSNLDAVSGQIAVHYEHAGLVEQAILYYQRAAKVAQQTFSNVEAASLLARALALLSGLPDIVERSQMELNLLLDRNPALMASKGYGHPEVERSLLRTWDLCRELGAHEKAIEVLAALWVCNNLKGDLEQQIILAERLKHEIRDTADIELNTIAYCALAGTALFRGEFLAARQNAAKGLSNFNASQLRSGNDAGRRSLINVFGLEPGVALMPGLALTLWLLGYPDQARRCVEQGFELASNYGQAASIAATLGMGTIVYQWRGEVLLTGERAAATIDFATEKELPQWVAHGQMLEGWALGRKGQVETGIAHLQQGLETWQAMGAGVSLTYYYLLLAELFSLSAEFEEGLQALQEAFTVLREGGETWMEAELYRCQGELLLKGMSDDKQAEVCFLQALEIAHRQQARSFELHAAMSLVRLWQRGGKQNAARQILSEVYGWFSEGFNTSDLQQAEALLRS